MVDGRRVGKEGHVAVLVVTKTQIRCVRSMHRCYASDCIVLIGGDIVLINADGEVKYQAIGGREWGEPEYIAFLKKLLSSTDKR